MKRKIVYLTIDDSPSSDFKRKVNYLYSKKIPAIFFCRGDYMKKREKWVIYAIKKGFVIGNHSYSHPFFSLISTKRAREEIKKTDSIIEKIYKKAKIKRPEKIFRFPYGDKCIERRRKIQKILLELGYKQPEFKNINYFWFRKLGFKKDLDVSWTYDIMEYKIYPLQKIFHKMKKRNSLFSGSLINNKSNEIILTHDHEKTIKMFIPIIEKLISMNLKFELPKFK